MVCPPHLLDLAQPLLEVVPQLPLGHNFGALLCSVVDIENELSAGDPLLKSLSHHDSVGHVPDPLQLGSLAVGRPNRHIFLALALL